VAKSKRAKPRETAPRPGQGGRLDVRCIFRLYVAGRTPRYEAAHLHLKQLCKEHFAGNYSIEMVDLLEHPERARTDNVIAIPMLERVSPEPVVRIIGDLSDKQSVLGALGVSMVTTVSSERLNNEEVGRGQRHP